MKILSANIIFNTLRSLGSCSFAVEGGDLTGLGQASYSRSYSGHSLGQWCNIFHSDPIVFRPGLWSNSVAFFWIFVAIGLCAVVHHRDCCVSFTQYLPFWETSVCLKYIRVTWIEMHREVAPWKFFSPICLFEFHTCEHSANHVRYRSSVCRIGIMMQPPVLSVEQAAQFDTDASGQTTALRQAGRRLF